MEDGKDFKIIVRCNQEYKVPYATDEQVAYVENTIIEKCKPYLGKIFEMDDATFEEFLNDKAMLFDVERGLIPGQIPHIIYRHSKEFELFDDALWEEINRRLDKP